MIYWETSTKPLFIKTVWSNGHHHALLQNEDQPPFTNKIQRRNTKNTSNKSSNPRPKKIENDNLNISPVTILSPNGRKDSISKTPRKYENPYREVKRTYTIDVIPGETMKFKDFNKEITFKPKIAAFGVRYQKQKEEIIVPEKTNGLSERVMVWLDLAAQNGQLYYHQTTTVKPGVKERSRTAVAPIEVREEVCDVQINSAAEEEIYSEPEEQQNVERFNGFAHDKRQLHIFIPNIPSKRTEYDGESILSTLSSNT